MSKQRQRDRATREAKARAAGEPVAKTARPQDAGRSTTAASSVKRQTAPKRQTPPKKQTAPKKQAVYRQRRFPQLPWRLKAALALLWVAVAVLALLFVPTWQGRIGVMVLATFALPLIVVIVRDPSRRTR